MAPPQSQASTYSLIERSSINFTGPLGKVHGYIDPLMKWVKRLRGVGETSSIMEWCGTISIEDVYLSCDALLAKNESNVSEHTTRSFYGSVSRSPLNSSSTNALSMSRSKSGLSGSLLHMLVNQSGKDKKYSIYDHRAIELTA